MFRPLSVCLGLRYIGAKKRNHFISFITVLSTLGIALGVLVLITVMSVMNGFDEQITHKIFSMVPSVSVSSASGPLSPWKPLAEKASMLEGVKAVEPVVNGQGMLNFNQQNKPAYINGIQPSYMKNIIEISTHMIEGSVSSLTPKSYHLILGSSLAYQLGVGVGDKLILITPQLSYSPAGVMPRLKRFTVSGIFHVTGSFNYNDNMVFININDAQTLYKLGKGVSQLDLKTTQPFEVDTVTNQLSKIVSRDYQVSNWAYQYGNFFSAIKMEKTMMFFILMLIVAVAIFNLVSMLVMAVNEKSASIAILRTYGASKGFVMRVFITQGFSVGFIGTVLGVSLGVLLSLHVTGLVNWLQEVFHTQFVSSDVYFVDYLPSKLSWPDVKRIALVSLLLSFLATLYPAWRAASVDPASVLRYE
jgi:lipoprotein-releasing system permease protein